MSAIGNRPSQVNENYGFNEGTWVASLLNTGPAHSGHAMIVVEGIEKGKQFVGQYDLYRKAVSQETIGEIVQSTLGNNQGCIAAIRAIESEQYGKGSYFGYSSRSWYAKPEDIKKMIASIKEQKQILENAVADGKPSPYPYQAAGSYRAWIFGGNGGDSCLTWAEKKLRVARIEPKGTWADWIKALPELHVNSKFFTWSKKNP